MLNKARSQGILEAFLDGSSLKSEVSQKAFEDICHLDGCRPYTEISESVKRLIKRGGNIDVFNDVVFVSSPDMEEVQYRVALVRHINFLYKGEKPIVLNTKEVIYIPRHQHWSIKEFEEQISDIINAYGRKLAKRAWVDKITRMFGLRGRYIYQLLEATV